MNGNPANLRRLMGNNMLGKANLKLLFICAVLVLGIGCQKPMIPEYLGLNNLQMNKMSGGKTSLSANAKFFNSNHFKVQLKRADLDISINDKPVDHYLLDSTIFIPAKDTFYVPVSLSVDLQHIFSNALELLMAKAVKITLDGKVKLKRGPLTFKRHVHYEVNQQLNSLLQNEN